MLVQDGRVWVTEGNAATVASYSLDGELLIRWRLPGLHASTWGVAIGPDGDVYVVEAQGCLVYRYHPDGTFVSRWGGTGSGPGQLRLPLGIAIGPAGPVYVPDGDNSRVCVFSLEGEFLASYGAPFPGPRWFDQPFDIHVAPDGTVLCSNHGDGRIVRFTADGIWLASYDLLAQTRFAVDETGKILVPRWYEPDNGATRVDVFSPLGALVCTLGDDWGLVDTGLLSADKSGTLYIGDRVADTINRLVPTAVSVAHPSWGALKAHYR
jgi:DNA-binding beta-propeller fold protein YncE